MADVGFFSKIQDGAHLNNFTDAAMIMSNATFFNIYIIAKSVLQAGYVNNIKPFL